MKWDKLKDQKITELEEGGTAQEILDHLFTQYEEDGIINYDYKNMLELGSKVFTDEQEFKKELQKNVNPDNTTIPYNTEIASIIEEELKETDGAPIISLNGIRQRAQNKGVHMVNPLAATKNNLQGMAQVIADKIAA